MRSRGEAICAASGGAARARLVGVRRLPSHSLGVLATALFIAAACGAGTPAAPGGTPATSSAADQPEARTVSGIVTDAQGKPLPDTHIWAEVQAIYATPRTGTAGPDGRYRVSGLFDQYVYRAHAWHALHFGDADWCLQVAPSPATGSDIFTGDVGAIRDFAWILSGPVVGTTYGPGDDGAFWGATIRIMPNFSDGNYERTLELTLVPQGALADGSTGATLTRTVAYAETPFALDIPLGRYTVSAVALDAGGKRTPLLVAQSGGQLAATTDFAFEPESFQSCGSASSSNGIARAFLNVALP